MFKFFNREDNVSKKGLRIVYEDGIVRDEILSWCKILGIRNFDSILLSLGFKETDTIYLYQDYGNLFTIFYSVNKNDVKTINNNSIRFNYKKKELIVSSGNEIKCYNINSLNDEDKKVDISLFYYKKKISDKISCFHKVGNNNTLFIIDNGDYELTLEIYLNVDNSLSFSNIIDENKLEEYLVSLEFPIVIDEVYKKVWDILKLDESVIDMFNLVVTKNVDKRKPDEVIDEILIQKGEFWRIIKTSDNRRVSLDKDGNWSYEKLEGDSLLAVKYCEGNEPKYRYSFKDRSKEESGYFSEEGLSELKKDAKSEVYGINKLVRTMFGKNNVRK